MYLFQLFEPIIYNNDVTIHVFIARLLDIINYQDITLKITAIQTLTKYVRHCKQFHKAQFLHPVFQNALKLILSQNKQILNSNCILIIKIFDIFEGEFDQFSNPICDHINKAYKIHSFGHFFLDFDPGVYSPLSTLQERIIITERS